MRLSALFATRNHSGGSHHHAIRRRHKVKNITPDCRPSWSSITEISFILLLCLAESCLAADEFPTIVALFPDQGIDYATQDQRGKIFDMSLVDGTVALTNDIRVPRPYNIDSVNPYSSLDINTNNHVFSSVREINTATALRATSSWSLAIPFQQSLASLASFRKGDVAKNIVGELTALDDLNHLLGFEVGFSQSSTHEWSRSQLESVAGYVVDTEAQYNYVEVFTRRATLARLSLEFLQSFALLPSAPFDTLSEADQRVYRTFFNDYGTHYALAAKFGGSYRSSVYAQSCQLVTESHTIASFEKCLSARTTGILGLALGYVGLNIEVCEGYTSDGRARSTWTSGQYNSKETWEGGSLQEVPSLQTGGDLSPRIQDVQRNPRATPTQLRSIPELLRDLLNAFDLAEEFCISCQNLKSMGLTREAMGSRVDNVDSAFLEYLYEALETKLEREQECTLECGLCGDIPPNDDCSCPLATLDSCHIEDPTVMDVYISSIQFAHDGVGLTRRANHMYVAGLGPPHDGGPYGGTRSVLHFDVDKTFRRTSYEHIYVEVVNGGPGSWHLYRGCKGSASFPISMVGSGETEPLRGGCIYAAAGPKSNNARVLIKGNITFPFCCGCEDLAEVEVKDIVSNGFAWWHILLITIGCLVGCCCIVGVRRCLAEEIFDVFI